MADRPHEQRKMRAAQNDGVDIDIAQRRGDLAHDPPDLGRVEHVLVLEPALLKMRAGRKLVLHDLDKTGGGASVDVDTRIEVLDRARVCAGPDGEVGGEHAHLARARGVDGGARSRGDHADNGHVERLLRDAPGGSRRRVAGDDQDLDAVVRKPTPRLERKRPDLVLGAHTVGTALGVAKVVDGLMRQRVRDGARDREAAQTRVEHADGAGVDIVVDICTDI